MIYFVSKSLVIESPLEQEPAERTVVVVLVLQGLHKLKDVHLYGLVLHLGTAQALHGVLVDSLVWVLLVQQLEGVLQGDSWPCPQKVMQLLIIAVFYYRKYSFYLKNIGKYFFKKTFNFLK